nr:hypothetical protein [Ailanthus crinkle leaf associated bluner-like virus]
MRRFVCKSFYKLKTSCIHSEILVFTMDATTLSAVRFVAVQLLALSSVMWNDVARETGPVKLPPGLLPANSADVVADLSSRLALAPVAAASPSVGTVAVSDVGGAIPASPAQVAPPAVSVAPVTPAAPVMPVVKAPAAAAGAAPAPPVVPAVPAVAPVANKPGAVGRHKRSVGSNIVDGVADFAGDVASSVIDHVGDVAHVTSVAADAASEEIDRPKRDVGNAIAEIADTISDVAGSCAGAHLPGRLCASVASAADAVEDTVESDQRNIARLIF